MAVFKVLNILKSKFFELIPDDFKKKVLIYLLITKKQSWKNKNLPISFIDSVINLHSFFTPNLNDSKGIQIKNLFSKVNITIPYENFIFSIDEFKTVSYNYNIFSNLSIDYSKVLTTSLYELKEKYDGFDEYSLNQLASLEAIEILIDRIVHELKLSNREDKYEFIHYFENIKTQRASSFKESLQRILFFNQILWQTGHNLNGFGRLDYILDEIYTNDNISKEESLKLIKEFLISSHTHFEYKSNSLIGDTGQIIVLGGLTNNEYFTNDLTYLFMEAVKELNQPDPKLILRYAHNIPRELLNLSVSTMSTGVGSPLISNDEIVIPNLINFGYDSEDAYNYVVSACWEPAPVGKGLELNNVDCLVFIEPLNELLDNEDLSLFNNFNIFFNTYKIYLKKYIENLLNQINLRQWESDPILSLFIENCDKNHLDLSQGGAVYNHYGLTSVSLSNTVNSLFNIKKLVFEENRYSLNELNNARKNNFSDEIVLTDLKNQKKFGMDDDEIISLTNDITKFTSNLFSSKSTKFGDKFKFGLSAPSYISKSYDIGASMDGRKDAEPFNVHISLEDNKDYTELMRFASKLEYTEHRFNGNVVDFMVSPNFINKNFDKFVDFIKLSVDMGVFQMQLNVVDSKILIDAQKNPNLYPNLIVRVWGFSTYFKDLPKDYQDVLIKRALENDGNSN